MVIIYWQAQNHLGNHNPDIFHQKTVIFAFCSALIFFIYIYFGFYFYGPHFGSTIEVNKLNVV